MSTYIGLLQKELLNLNNRRTLSNINYNTPNTKAKTLVPPRPLFILSKRFCRARSSQNVLVGLAHGNCTSGGPILTGSRCIRFKASLGRRAISSMVAQYGVGHLVRSYVRIPDSGPITKRNMPSTCLDLGRASFLAASIPITLPPELATRYGRQKTNNVANSKKDPPPQCPKRRNISEGENMNQPPTKKPRQPATRAPVHPPKFGFKQYQLQNT